MVRSTKYNAGTPTKVSFCCILLVNPFTYYLFLSRLLAAHSTNKELITMRFFGRDGKWEMLDDVPKMAPIDDAGVSEKDTNATDEMEDKTQGVLKDNLEIMREIVFRIREDPAFAKSIYKDCPRLQALLVEHPDLRPIFEDPKLVKINFEKVFRDNGGVLPEDDPPKEPWLITKWYDSAIERWRIITAHPLFKVFRILMFVKKVMGLLSPTKGLTFITGIFTSCFFDAPPDPPEAPPENLENAQAKLLLYSAADHMEDPEVQEKMQGLLADPESMDEAIDNDPQLSALREANPLCAELMKDPETMKILVDPENLRALGECPDLIEADFADPDGFQYEIPESLPAIEGDDLYVEEPEDEAQNIFQAVEDETKENVGNKQRGKDSSKSNDPDVGGAIGYMGAFGSIAGALGVDFSALNPGISLSDLNPGIEFGATEVEVEEETTFQEHFQEELEGDEDELNKSSGDQNPRNRSGSSNPNDPNVPQENQGMFGSAKGMLIGAMGGVAAGMVTDMAFGEVTSMMSEDSATVLEDFIAAIEDIGDDNAPNDAPAAGDGTRGVNDSTNPDGTLVVGDDGTATARMGRFAFHGTAGAALSSMVAKRSRG